MPRNIKKTVNYNPLDIKSATSKLVHTKQIAVPVVNQSVDFPSPTVLSNLNPLKENTMTSAETILDNEIGSLSNSAADSATDYRLMLAKQTAKNWSQWAATAGFIPLTMLGTVAISGIQIKMISEICKVYDVPFKKEAVLAIISGLVGGSLSVNLSSALSQDVIKNIPYIGTALVVVTQPAFSYASTYALGLVFIDHFESKGTLLDLTVEKVKGNFVNEYDKAKHFLKKQFRKNENPEVAPL